MQRWGIALALAVAAASLAAASPSHPEPALSLPATKDPRPLLGIAGEWGDQRLVRLDPRSLRPRRGPSLDIFGGGGAWVFSPDRSQLALGTACQAGISLGTLQLVEVRRMRPVGCFGVGRVGAVAWPTPNRLLVVAGTPPQVLLIDPKVGRIVGRTPIEGVELGTARARNRLVMLTGSALREPERLVVADARGNVHAVGLDAPHARDVVVDPGGRRAYLVSAGTVAEVDLDTLVVTYHDLTETSVLGRLFNWLVPAAKAKEFHQELRTTLWVGGGLIASFGSDFAVSGRTATSAPVGLRLIDTRTWTARMVDEQVGFALLAEDVLLAVGAEEIGLVAYDLHGTKRFQLFRGRSPVPVESYRGKAYVYVEGKSQPQVVDTRTGRALGPRRALLPDLLVER